jgi:hypothetical protein
MRPDANPLIPQFWLWGLDAIAGDLVSGMKYLPVLTSKNFAV